MLRARRAALLGALAVVGLAAGCGGGDGSEGGDGGAASTAVATDPFAALDAPPAGEGGAVLGIEELHFAVTACDDGPGADDPPEATRELRVAGDGENSDGPFTVEILRYRSDTGNGPPLVTETAQVVYGEGDGARGVEARRTTAGSGGAWLDLTDPDADAPLIGGPDGAVDVRATFGPDRARAGDDGLVEGRIRATCPA